MSAAPETRRTLINMALRRQRGGAGSRTEFLRERTARLRFPDLRETLYGIPWAATGAAGARLYMPERMTRDLDILIRQQDADAVRVRLEQTGAKFRGELSIGGTSWALKSGFPVDIIESGEEWVEPALKAAADNPDAQGMPVLPLSYQVMMKFRASRFQDLADISRMLGQASDEQIEETRALFYRWLPKDLDDLESLIALGRLELQDSVE